MSEPFDRLLRRRMQEYDHDDVTPRPPRQSRTVIVEVMEIEHVNNAGYVHGGTIMRMVDTAAGIAAARHARRRVVTATMDQMDFLSPVYIGDVVHVQASVNDAHRTSMEIGVRVDVEAMVSGDRRHVASAHLVFVALDEQGRPTPVAPLLAETDDDRRRQAQARVRREHRLLRREALRRAAEPPEGSAAEPPGG